MKASGLCGSDLHMYRLPAAEFPELDMKAEMGYQVAVATAERASAIPNMGLVAREEGGAEKWLPPLYSIANTIRDWLSRESNVKMELTSVCHSYCCLKKSPVIQYCEHGQNKKGGSN